MDKILSLFGYRNRLFSFGGVWFLPRHYNQGPYCRNCFYGIRKLQPSFFICAKLRYYDLRGLPGLLSTASLSERSIPVLRNSRTFASHAGTKKRILLHARYARDGKHEPRSLYAPILRVLLQKTDSGSVLNNLILASQYSGRGTKAPRSKSFIAPALRRGRSETFEGIFSWCPTQTR